MLAAILLPFLKPVIYKTSPCSKYHVAGVPVISIVGAVALGWWIILLYGMATIPALGVISLPSIEFLAGVYVFGACVYYAFKWFRKREGIDVSFAFKEIPPE
jgi:hypothetical protein